ncbi:sigma-70 family RNA polymerase sigma factor [Thiothrix subterranea]|uniref:Sigma-70 family RNA polymerase sigma factor n=1 Tax=Thiothrix subterranea TaxID=2735563 RepID=A0AA51MSV5_9GAMM|nr:sigma-70 family RNA polymerase sigma factor [Thiothrix subterranea]MDQ5768300.1 sigma-70 family RNA polymerase sigma factor [Thiothrix subterranea]WML87827.1 sigma-70 family RNA polymerase sigma factor [Thiothrix subterranea]
MEGHSQGSKQQTELVSKLSDEALMERISQGDQQAFSQLYLRYQPKLVKYCSRVLRDDMAQAADLVDEAMFDVWRSAENSAGRSKVSTWIYSITRNKMVSWLRKTSEMTLEDESILDAMIDPAASPHEELALDDMKQQLLRLMDQLTEEHREVIRLTYFEDKSVKEVAIVLDISENTVKTRMFYARKRLAQLLEKAGIVGVDF